jgi:hypothetical protein
MVSVNDDHEGSAVFTGLMGDGGSHLFWEINSWHTRGHRGVMLVRIRLNLLAHSTNLKYFVVTHPNRATQPQRCACPALSSSITI